ncbi:hypothetical protein RB597_010152 [Gaeumannomyces tritici]
MPFEFGLCEPEDLERCFEVVSLAFGHDHPYIDALFPAHDTPQGRADGARWLVSALRDPSGTGRAARLCRHRHGPHCGLRKVGHLRRLRARRWAGQPQGRPLARQGGQGVGRLHLVGVYAPPLGRAQGERGHLVCEFRPYICVRVDSAGGPIVPFAANRGRAIALDIMSVDPAYQRRGVGATLMKYGVDEADRLGLEAVVEPRGWGGIFARILDLRSGKTSRYLIRRSGPASQNSSSTG